MWYRREMMETPVLVPGGLSRTRPIARTLLRLGPVRAMERELKKMIWVQIIWLVFPLGARQLMAVSNPMLLHLDT